MPRILARAGILMALLAPSLAFAVYNDVTLTTDTILSVNGVTLNVSGSSATIESIVINDGSMVVTLSANSIFEVTAPNLEPLSTNTIVGLASDICSSSKSLLKYNPGTESVTVTIGVAAGSSCATGGGGSSVNPTPAATPAASSGGGGGGGGGTSVVTTPTVTTPTTPAPNIVTGGSGLSSAQIQSILALLASFNADASVIANVQASLGGQAASGGSATSMSSFARNLETGATGDDVKALQQYLNSHGFTIVVSGAGSPGQETTRFGSLTRAALIKFQKANGITPSAGYFGSKTRAYLVAHP